MRQGPVARVVRRAPSLITAIASLLLCLAVLVPAAANASSVDQATSYQLDPAHDGYQTAPITAPLSQVWSFSLPALQYATLTSEPLIVNGVVYITVNGTLYALSQATGATLWSRNMSGTYDVLNISYDAGQVFAVNFAGTMTALNANSGTVDWTTTLPGQYEFDYPPVATNGYVYVDAGGTGGTIYAVAEATGQVDWTASDENGDGSPAVDATGVYSTEVCGYYSAFAPLTGGSLWSEAGSCDGGGGHTATLAAGYVFARDPTAGDTILSESTGATVASFSSQTAPAVGGNVAYTIVSGQLDAVSDSGLGTTAWTFSGDSNLNTAPLLVGNLIFAASSAGNVYAVNAADGTQAWTANAGSAISGPGQSDSAGIASGENTLLVPTSDALVEYAGANVGSGTPTNMTAPAVVGTPVVGRPIGADVGVWSALPSSYTYQWSQCNGASCTNLPGATGEAYTPTAADLGLTLEVTVTATNTSGTSTSVTSAASGAVASPPSDVTPPTIGGSAAIGQTLTASAGTWSPTPTGVTYQWLRCSAGSCTHVAGATSGTYAVSAADVGSLLEVQVTASNAVGTASATSQPTSAVAVVPTTVKLTSSKTTANVGDAITLSASVSPAVNGGTFTFSESGQAIAGCSDLAVTSAITCPGVAVSAGIATITGTYSGDGAYGTSSASVTITIVAPGSATPAPAQPIQSTQPIAPAPPVLPPSRIITRPGRSRTLPDFSLKALAVRRVDLVPNRYYWAVQNVACYNHAAAVLVTVNRHTVAVPCNAKLVIASQAVADHVTYAITFQAVRYNRHHKVAVRGVVYRASMYMPGPEAQWTSLPPT